MKSDYKVLVQQKVISVAMQTVKASPESPENSQRDEEDLKATKIFLCIKMSGQQ